MDNRMVSDQLEISDTKASVTNGVAATLLRLIQRHTSLEEARLKDEARTILDNPASLDTGLAVLIAKHWIEHGGAGWRISKKGEAWLNAEGESTSIEEEELGIDDEPKKPYDVAKLKVEQRTLSVFQALRKIERHEIILNPDFQRAFVWDEVRQSRLIESILVRIPLPAFYIDATDLVRWNVVDGLQRLNTLYRYCRTQSFALTGLEFLTELNGAHFSKLPQKYQVLIEDDTQLIFNNLLPGTPVEAKFTIFSRVNTGGLQLTAQEIRHALNQGPITELLKKLSSSTEFLNGTDRAVPSKRMADQELILRSLSFLHFGWRKYQDFAELDKYLVHTMQQFNHRVAEGDLRKLGSQFLASIAKVKSIFESYAFRKFYERGGRRGPLNKSLFETWTVSVRDYDQDALIRSRDRIINGFLALMNSNVQFNNSITYGTGKFSSVKTRYDGVESLLREMCK